MLSGLPVLVGNLHPAWRWGYPLGLAAMAMIYGHIAGGWAFHAVAAGIVAGVMSLFGSGWYALLRRQVAGLDRIAWGLASFAVAALISLGKAGLLRRWLERARPWMAARARRSGRRRALDG